MNVHRKKIAALVAIGAFAGAGCGGAATPDEQVRATEVQILAAATSDTPGSMCKFALAQDDCLQGIVMAKAFGIDLKALIPEDWRDRVAKAKITVNGNRATAAAIGGDSDKTEYVKRQGQWLFLPSGEEGS